MLLSDLNGKEVCILGFGREGRATLRALKRAAPQARITVADTQAVEAEGCTLQTGDTYLQHLERFDVIIKSPGIPPGAELTAVAERITNATQIFLEEAAKQQAQVIGVTGSKGKSTTASLLHAVLQAAGKDSRLVGNIGEPALDHLEGSSTNTIFIQEMSSYQLMDLQTSPPIAVVTSFFPEHLDYHGSVEAYRQAKAHIALYQKPEDIIFYNAESPGATWIAQKSAGRQVPFTKKDAAVPLEHTQLLGQHNLLNIAAVCAVAQHLEISPEAIQKGISEFPGLPHRLQALGEIHGIRWVDDAISTTPQSAIAALDALENDVSCIILGGQDRGFSYDELAQRIKHSTVEHALLLPESGSRIGPALKQAGCSTDIHEVLTLDQAVQEAKNLTSKGKICLLSPASPSYNQFKNFEERGKAFADAIGQE